MPALGSSPCARPSMPGESPPGRADSLSLRAACSVGLRGLLLVSHATSSGGRGPARALALPDALPAGAQRSTALLSTVSHSADAPLAAERLTAERRSPAASASTSGRGYHATAQLPRPHSRATPLNRRAQQQQQQQQREEQLLLEQLGMRSGMEAAQHPTLALIASRVRSGSQPGGRRDGMRLGLVVEGGGMRGIISGAMLEALHELGLTHAFDVVYGASAGAINATYFLAGQRNGLTIYHEDLTRGASFLDFRNLFGSEPVMNLGFLIDTVMDSGKPLDWDAVLRSRVPLKVVASCLDSLQPVLLSDFASRADLVDCLKATANVPQFAGPPRRVRGRSLVDAAVFEAVPVPSAIRDGCTHVLALCTRPEPARYSPWVKRVRTSIEHTVQRTVLNAPYMREAWRTAQSPHLACPDELLLSALRSCPHQVRDSMGAFVLPLYPESTAGCHPLCLDPPTLLAASQEGRTALRRMLGPIAAAGEAGAGAGAGLQAPEGVSALGVGGADMRYRL